MVKLYDKGAYLVDGIHIVSEEEGAVQNLNGKELRKEDARKGTISDSF